MIHVVMESFPVESHLQAGPPLGGQTSSSPGTSAVSEGTRELSDSESLIRVVDLHKEYATGRGRLVLFTA